MNDSHSEKNRIIWLDVAKGLGMLAIIISHLKLGILTQWLFTFHVPLFFFLSGFVFSRKRGLYSFTKRKVKSILVPYFCLGLPVVACYATGGYLFGDFISNELGYEVTVTTISEVQQLFGQFFLQQRMWTLWFLTCLFCLNIIFYLCNKYIIHTDIGLAALSCIFASIGLTYYHLGGQPLIWNVDICFTAFPFMFLGYFYRKRQNTIDSYIRNHAIGKYLIFIFLAINMAAGYLSLKLSGEMFEMYTSSYGIPILSYISAFAGIGFILMLSRKIRWEPVRYIGRNSMIFLAWHQVIMMPISAALLSICHFSLETAEEIGIVGVALYKLIQLLLILVLCTGFNELILKLKLKFMLGRW